MRYVKSPRVLEANALAYTPLPLSMESLKAPCGGGPILGLAALCLERAVWVDYTILPLRFAKNHVNRMIEL